MATMIGQNIAQAIAYLLQGDVVGIPTETVYGLAGNAYSMNSIKKIYSIKQRPFGDPLIVHTHHIDCLQDLVKTWPPLAQALADYYWPGPLTLLLPKQNSIPSTVTAGLSTVGVRIPSHPMTQDLLKALPFPLAAPSANPFGYISPTTAQHVADQLGNQIPYILNGGPCEKGLESTIIGFSDSKPIIYRLGSITLEDIKKNIGHVTYQPRHHDNHTKANAPGTFAHHYAPHTKLLIGDVNTLLKQHNNRKVGALLFKPQRVDLPQHQVFILSQSGSLQEAAKRLFTGLRHLDSLGCDIIIAAALPDYDLGKTINERLIRASSR